METAFRLPSGVNEDFIRNLLWQHHQQQQQLENNQFTSPPPTPAMSETSSGNALDETEENDFDQRNVEEENNLITKSYSLLEQARKKSETSFQSMSTIQSSTSEAESSLDLELFIELIRQFPVIWNPKLNCFKDHAKKKNAWNQINTALGGSFSCKITL